MKTGKMANTPASILSTMIQKGILAGLRMMKDEIAIREIMRICEDKFPDIEGQPTMGQFRYALKELTKSGEVIERREGPVLFYKATRGKIKPLKAKPPTEPKRQLPVLNNRLVDQTNRKFEIFIEGVMITVEPEVIAERNITISENPITGIPCIEFRKKLLVSND